MRGLHAVLTVVLFIVAGCTTTGPMGGPASETPTDPEAHAGMTADVDIRSLALDPVTIIITETSNNGRGVVLNRTYTNVTIEFGDGTLLRKNAEYRVLIRVNGTTRWNETVEHFESYELRIENNGSVTVRSHAMA